VFLYTNAFHTRLDRYTFSAMFVLGLSTCNHHMHKAKGAAKHDAGRYCCKL